MTHKSTINDILIWLIFRSDFFNALKIAIETLSAIKRIYSQYARNIRNLLNRNSFYHNMMEKQSEDFFFTCLKRDNFCKSIANNLWGGGIERLCFLNMIIQIDGNIFEWQHFFFFLHIWMEKRNEQLLMLMPACENRPIIALILEIPLQKKKRPVIMSILGIH